MAAFLVALMWTVSVGTVAQSGVNDPLKLAIEVKAQDLSSALIELSGLFETTIFADPAFVEGRIGNAVVGSLALEDALRQVLKGTGLTAVPSVAGGYQIVEASRVATDGSSQSRVDSSAPLEQVLVYGTKRYLSVQDTQASVSVVTATDIEEQALFTVEDILLRTANVSTGGDGTLNSLSIRGVSLGGVGGAGDGLTANVYVDGSPNSQVANTGAANLWDVEQVEVLRGPQSTTQGRNALAGALVTTSADPVYEFAADARAVVGNENNRQYSATLNIPLIDNTLAFRGSIDHREIDFEVINVDTGVNTRFQEALTGRAKLLWEPTDELRLELGYTRTETDIGELNLLFSPSADSPEFEDFDPFGRETYGNRQRFTDVEVDRYYLETQWELNKEWSLFALVTREDGSSEATFGVGGRTLSDNTTYTAELRTEFDFGRLSGWVGAYWFDIDSPIVATTTGSFPLPTIPADVLIDAIVDTRTATQNRALFADVTYELSEHWSINAGLRYDEEEFQNLGGQSRFVVTPADCVISPLIPLFGGRSCIEAVESAFPSEGGQEIQAEFDAWLPRASIIYRFDDERTLSFNYARGYRAGGSFLRPVLPPEILQYGPEYLNNFELAWRSEWFANTLVLNANLFYSEWEDQQVAIPGPLGFELDTLIVNAGSSELFGLEVEAQWKISNTLSGFAALGLVRTEFKDFPFAVDANGNPTNPEDPTYANLAGNAFNNAPETTFSIGLIWDHGSGLFASGNISYASGQFSDVTNLPQNETGSYTLVNARAGYRWSNWTAAVFADNLLDDRFILGQQTATVSTITGAVQDGGGAGFFRVNDPRVYGLEMRYSY